MTVARGAETDAFAVRSRDGTTIAGSVGGKGPPVVLVHGTTGSDFSWALVRPHLEGRFSVYAVQRRGRGRSGDGPEHSLRREAEDVAAVIDSIGEPAGLVGHSYGANCCLEASLLTPNMTRLVLYEPVVGGPVDESALRDVEALVAAGRNEAAVEMFLREAAGLTGEEIAFLRSSPTWEERVAAAHTLSREERAAGAYPLAPERFAGMTVPTLLLTGSESPPEYRTSIDRIDAVLPDSTIHVLERQGHAANVSAPELLAEEIIGFVHSRDPGGPRS